MRKRIAIPAIGLVIVVAILLAAAAGGGDDDETTSPPTTSSAGEAPAPTTTPPDPATPVEPPATTAAPGTTAPSDTTAGTSGSSDLPPDLQLVTSEWPTDFSMRTIDLSELKVGILAPDPRDAIRPLDGPSYETVASADEWLVDRELGILFEYEGHARFYPLRILTSHEVVNDEIDGFPYVVTYCPLCNTAVAFPREVDGRVLRFGVSGLLRKSDLVMWDDATVSLWQQTSGKGIVGEFAGTQLEFLPTALIRWQEFKESHPDGEVLSRDTGFPFSYSQQGYVGYTSRDNPFPTFFDEEIDPRFRALERVVGLRVGEVNKAYPFPVIRDERAVNDVVDGRPVTVWWGAEDTSDPLDAGSTAGGDAIGTGVAYIAEVDGRVLTFRAVDDTLFMDEETGTTWNILGEAVDGPLAGEQLQLAVHQNEFWFAWSSFNPDSPVYMGADG